MTKQFELVKYIARRKPKIVLSVGKVKGFKFSGALRYAFSNNFG